MAKAPAVKEPTVGSVVLFKFGHNRESLDGQHFAPAMVFRVKPGRLVDLHVMVPPLQGGPIWYREGVHHEADIEAAAHEQKNFIDPAKGNLRLDDRWGWPD